VPYKDEASNDDLNSSNRQQRKHRRSKLREEDDVDEDEEGDLMDEEERVGLMMKVCTRGFSSSTVLPPLTLSFPAVKVRWQL
jgi:hypothetical protein